MRARIASIGLVLFACSGGETAQDAGAPTDAQARADAAADGGAPADAGAPLDTGPMSCGDCGAPTTCAVPFCDEITWTCDPGYLTQALVDETSGDCMAPACDGANAEAVIVVDDSDLPPDPIDVCGKSACEAGVPGVATATVGTPCRGQPGFCDGQGLDAESCKRCADTETDPYAVDVGCTRARNFCYQDASLARGGCFAATAWDDAWGGSTIGTDGLTIANTGLGTTHARSTFVATTGRYYWEVRAVMADSRVNGGGIGLVSADAPESISFIGDGPTGVGFGYSGSPQYFSGWRSVTYPSGNPPEAVYLSTGRVYMLAYDADMGRLWVGAEGIWFNGGDPANDMNPAAIGIPNRMRAGATLYQGSAVLEANFMGPFQFAVPAGFRPGLF